MTKQTLECHCPPRGLRKLAIVFLLLYNNVAIFWLCMVLVFPRKTSAILLLYNIIYPFIHRNEAKTSNIILNNITMDLTST